MTKYLSKTGRKLFFPRSRLLTPAEEGEQAALDENIMRWRKRIRLEYKRK